MSSQHIHRSTIERVTVMFTYEELIKLAIERLGDSTGEAPDVNGAEVELTVNAGRFDSTEDFRLVRDVGGIQMQVDPPLRRAAVALEIRQVRG